MRPLHSCSLAVTAQTDAVIKDDILPIYIIMYPECEKFQKKYLKYFPVYLFLHFNVFIFDSFKTMCI